VFGEFKFGIQIERAAPATKQAAKKNRIVILSAAKNISSMFSECKDTRRVSSLRSE
jgi:hypothetical protein